MGWKFTFATSLAVLLLFAAPSKLFAQCTWCQTVTDVCCDAGGTGVNYELPCATSDISVYFDTTNLNGILVEITNLDTNTILYSQVVGCDCQKKVVLSNLSLAAGTNLRLKASCDPCVGEGDCSIGSASVKFFTPSSNTCAPNCSGS